jgi:hypothetical protein
MDLGHNVEDRKVTSEQWQPMMFAPRDGTAFEARTKKGVVFGCRYDDKRLSFVNTATNHRVDPRVWRPSDGADAK